MTPTTVRSTPSSVTILPMTSGSAPNRRCQRPWPRITHRVGAPRLVALCEGASKHWPHAEHRERVRRHLRAVEPQGVSLTGQRRARDPQGRDMGERLDPRAQRQELNRIQRGGRLRGRTVRCHGTVGVLDDVDELVRIPVGQRCQQNRVDDAEDGRVGADAERKRRNRDRGEPRVPPQRAQPVADVLQHALQPRRDPDVMNMVAGERQVAQRAPCRGGRRGTVEPPRLQLLPLHLQVEPQLVVELALVTIALEQVAQAPEQPRHARPPTVASRTRWMAKMMRCTRGNLLARRGPPSPVRWGQGYEPIE